MINKRCPTAQALRQNAGKSVQISNVNTAFESAKLCERFGGVRKTNFRSVCVRRRYCWRNYFVKNGNYEILYHS